MRLSSGGGVKRSRIEHHLTSLCRLLRLHNPGFELPQVAIVVIESLCHEFVQGSKTASIAFGCIPVPCRDFTIERPRLRRAFVDQTYWRVPIGRSFALPFQKLIATEAHLELNWLDCN